MDRSAGLDYLKNQYGSGGSPLLDLAGLGVALTDTGPVKSMLDKAFLYAGTAYGDLATASVDNALKLMACIEYSAISWVLANINQLARVGVLGLGDGVSIDSREWRSKLLTQQAIARAEAIAQGAAIPTTDGVSYPQPINYSLDYLQLVEG